MGVQIFWGERLRLPTLHRSLVLTNRREHTTDDSASVISFGTKKRQTDPPGGWRRCRAASKMVPSVRLSINTRPANHQTDHEISQITQFYKKLCSPFSAIAQMQRTIFQERLRLISTSMFTVCHIVYQASTAMYMKSSLCST